jgi:hypothetical protein
MIAVPAKMEAIRTQFFVRRERGFQLPENTLLAIERRAPNHHFIFR